MYYILIYDLYEEIFSNKIYFYYEKMNVLHGWCLMYGALFRKDTVKIMFKSYR